MPAKIVEHFIVILLHLSAAAFYAAAMLRGQTAAQNTKPAATKPSADIIFLAAAMLLHALGLAINYQSYPRWDIGVGASLFALFAAAPCRALTRPGIIRISLLLFVALASLAPLAAQTNNPPPGGLSLAHALLAMASYALALATMLLWLELHLSEKIQRITGQAAPPLLQQEAACFRWLAVSFALLTLTLLSGLIASDGYALTHKNLFAALTWLVFAVLLLGRYLRGWRGRRAKAGFAAGFVFLLLSYFGSAFVLQIILQRS
ncbi:MAG: cytochrome c biogenesis protein CcsA [Gammaproteobacteria bacterium]